MIFFISFILFTFAVQGKPPLEFLSSGHVLDLSTRGVDAESCNSMVYQAKSCKDHAMMLLDGEGRELVLFVLRGWSNRNSNVTINPTGRGIIRGTPAILDCDTLRWFWMSWDSGRIKYGRGRVPGEKAVFDLEDPTGRQVKRFGLKKIYGRIATVRLGESERGRFARVLQEGKFSDGMISETSTSRENCASLCTEHEDCGMFSYNQDVGRCAIFDRMMSSFAVTLEIGWQSWKLLYCYP